MKFDRSTTIKIISELINGRIVGNSDLIISGINRIEEADSSEITFIADSKYLEFLNESNAACFIISESIFNGLDVEANFIVVDNARSSLNHILNYLAAIKLNLKRNFIHPTAIIGENCIISNSAYIGAYVVIGDNCIVNDDSVIHPSCVLYDNVNIGKHSVLNAKVVCYDGVIIGNNSIIHSGAIIGADGFGYEEQSDGCYIKIPQLGNVVIKDNVEIGANTTIDRALLGSTVIENGVKLDNLIQIAHNVSVGENSAMASQVGISGSTKIGKRNRIGGQSGLAGHINITDDVTLLARSGVAKSIEKKGFYFGAPVRERMRAFKIEAVINNLPELKQEVFRLNKIISELNEEKAS